MKPISSEKIDYTDVFDILDHIERKPGLFLLKPNLELLYSYLSGIKTIALANNITIKNNNELDGFSDFLSKKLNQKHQNAMGWFGIINANYGAGADGFNTFFKYLSEFRNR